jgi:hypothetical protein
LDAGKITRKDMNEYDDYFFNCGIDIYLYEFDKVLAAQIDGIAIEDEYVLLCDRKFMGKEPRARDLFETWKRPPTLPLPVDDKVGSYDDAEEEG